MTEERPMTETEGIQRYHVGAARDIAVDCARGAVGRARMLLSMREGCGYLADMLRGDHAEIAIAEVASKLMERLGHKSEDAGDSGSQNRRAARGRSHVR